MSIVNFSVPRVLDRKISEAVKARGFSSKAELFRYTVMRYFEDTEKLPLGNNPRIAFLTDRLEAELLSKLGAKSLPPLAKQLSRMKKL